MTPNTLFRKSRCCNRYIKVITFIAIAIIMLPNNVLAKNSFINTYDGLWDKAYAIYEKWRGYGEDMKIIGKYPNFSKYFIGLYDKCHENVYRELWIHNLETGITHKLEDCDLGGGVMAPGFSVENLSINENKNCLYIITHCSENNYYGLASVFLYAINLNSGTAEELCSGRDYYKNNDIFTFINYECIYEGECMADYLYAPTYNHCDAKGNPVFLTKSQMSCIGHVEYYKPSNVNETENQYVKMDINIDAYHNISGSCSYCNKNYTLSGKQQNDGELLITAKDRYSGNEIKFSLTAESKSKLCGVCYGTGKCNYIIELSF